MSVAARPGGCSSQYKQFYVRLLFDTPARSTDPTRYTSQTCSETAPVAMCEVI